MKLRIKKGDTVQVVTGKDSGKKGKVLSTDPINGKLVIDGVNILKKHNRPKKQGEKGQRVDINGSVNISNVMMVCPKCGKPTRVGKKKLQDKKTARICVKCKEVIS
ncbi:MAG: 50S ribosomal protein L24 [bacterium]